MKKRFSLSLVVFLMLIFTVAMVAGCAKKKEEAVEKKSVVEKSVMEEPVRGGTFNAFLMEPVTLDAANSQESEGISVAKEIYDGLVDYESETMEIIPAMAESWESNEDATVFTFKLKKGVKFHNGRECKAEDFVYSWSRVALKETASEVSYHLEPIKGFEDCQEGKTDTLAGVKATGDYILEVALKYPYAEFPVTLGHPIFSPVPKEEVEKWADKFFEHPMGTGPFKFAGWDHDQKIVLERFDDYYEDEAYLDKLVFNIFADEDTAFLEFEAGNLDECRIPLGRVKETQEKYKGKTIIKPMLGTYFYGLNMEAEPWKGNVNLRKALNYSIDRKAITDAVWEGARAPATGIVPAGIPGFKENAMSYVFDQPKTKVLLEEAGHSGGKGLLKLSLSYNTGVGHDKVAQAMQAQMKDVGVNFDIVGYEFGTFIDKIQAEEATFFKVDWGADYPTMDNFLYPLFSSESADNMFKYENSEVDEKLLEARKETDETKRQVLYREVERMVLEDAPVVPIAFDETSRVVGEDVHGYTRTAMDDTPFECIWLSK